MNTNFEKEVVEDLKRRKEIFRRYTRSLSATAKIRQLELLQRRHYNLLKIRDENGGRNTQKMAKVERGTKLLNTGHK